MLALHNLDALFHFKTPAAAEYRGVVNPSVLVIQPSEAEFEKIMSTIPTIHSSDGGELGFLEKCWGSSYTRFPTSYNAYLSDLGIDFENEFSIVVATKQKGPQSSTKSLQDSLVSIGNYKFHSQVDAIHVTGQISGEVTKAWLRASIPYAYAEALKVTGIGVKQGTLIQRRKRYAARLVVMDVFWNFYRQYWLSVCSIDSESTLGDISLAGIWTNTEGSVMHARQYQTRVFWTLYQADESSPVSMGDGIVVGDHITMRIWDLRKHLKDSRASICLFRLVHPRDSNMPLRLIHLWSSTLSTCHSSFPMESSWPHTGDPLLPEFNLSKKWALEGSGRSFINTHQIGGVIFAFPSNTFVPYRNETHRIFGFLEMGHTANLHGVYLQGHLFFLPESIITQATENQPQNLKEQAVVRYLTDNKRLIGGARETPHQDLEQKPGFEDTWVLSKDGQKGNIKPHVQPQWLPLQDDKYSLPSLAGIWKGRVRDVSLKKPTRHSLIESRITIIQEGTEVLLFEDWSETFGKGSLHKWSQLSKCDFGLEVASFGKGRLQRQLDKTFKLHLEWFEILRPNKKGTNCKDKLSEHAWKYRDPLKWWYSSASDRAFWDLSIETSQNGADSAPRKVLKGQEVHLVQEIHEDTISIQVPQYDIEGMWRVYNASDVVQLRLKVLYAREARQYVILGDYGQHGT
eukprot:TRINITY_DN7472_c0_g1_i2.p1 TRINITY_DN7472_c0_g1~~TRINITY_DN7472_c0_g1_i2.p1  ORF type:complete len:685 (+),score=100.84 TRINITY_DN7472_c0_g1_i2:1051-3105(+)